MTAPISVNPTVVSVLGDSWTAPARDKAAGYNSDFLPAAASGLGWQSAGPNYLLARFAWGGVSAKDAVEGVGNFPKAVASEPGPVPFNIVAPHDFAKYQVFRYGINDTLQALLPNLEDKPARPDYSLFLSQLNDAGLNKTHGIVNSGKWSAFRTNFRASMVSRLTSLCNSSISAGRKPLLAKMPLMTPMATGYWNWTERHRELMQEVNTAIDQVAVANGARIVDQTDSTLGTTQRVDFVHPNQHFAFLIAVDFGVKLRTALVGY